MPTTFHIPEGTPQWAIITVSAILGLMVVIAALTFGLIPMVRKFGIALLGLKPIIDQLKGDVQTTARATSSLIEANKSLPATPDVAADIEAQVKDIAEGEKR